MVGKPVLLFLFCQLLLQVIASKTHAEESILLIDKSQGIDNTVDPVAKHLDDLNKSLSNILTSEEISPKDETTPKKDSTDISKGSETEAILKPVETNKEETFLLFDSTKGIDNIDKLLSSPGDSPDKLEEKKSPIDNTDSDIEQQQPTPMVIAPDIKPVIKEKPDENTLNTTEQLKTTLKTTPQESPEMGIWIPKDSDLRILEIRVESYTLDDVIGAYQYQDIILIPLSSFSQILDIAIDVTTNFAEGFIITETNTFALDTVRGEVILKGISHSYETDLVKVLDNDIFVESNLLSKWLEMKLNIDLYSSRVSISSKKKLPFLARIDREKRMAQTLSRTDLVEPEYPRHHETYKNYTLPFIDQTLRMAQRFSDTSNITTFNSTTYATADLLQHESTWFLTLDDQNGVDDFRVTLGRTNPEGGLLNFLNAKEYKFGHITEPRVGLINSTGNLNYGISVSNHPIGLQTEYDQHRFIGELLPGWEVELYRNNALIGYQQTPVNGQYDFKDVPLLFGNNHFRLAFYGPKGEVREETRNFQLTQALTQQGEQYYRVSTITDEDGEQRTIAQLDYGLAKNISSSVDAVSIPLKESGITVQHNYLGLGLIGYWDSLLASTSVIDDSEGGNAMEINLQTRLNETVIGFKDIYLKNFFSEEFLPSATEVSRRSNLDINTAIPPSFIPRIPVTFGFRRDEYVTGDELFEITNQLSISARGIAITNQIANQKITNQQTTSNGNLQISTNISNVRFRSTIGYTLKPINEVSNVALTLDPGQFKDYRFSYGITHTLQQNLTEISATANRISGKYGLSFGIRYNNNDELNLDVNLSMGFGYEPKQKSWHQGANNLANQGSISARFFLDNNKDGLFNEGDTPIENAGVRVNNGYNKERSNSDGILFLTGLAAHEPTNIILATGTLSDPLWTPAIEGIKIVPRPGHAIQTDFPIFTTGEIDGIVEYIKNGKYIGVGNVTIELIDENDQIILTTETAFDGFYILSHIPMGKYTVRISRKQLDKLGLISPKTEPININGDEPFISGIDFTLKSK